MKGIHKKRSNWQESKPRVEMSTNICSKVQQAFICMEYLFVYSYCPLLMDAMTYYSVTEGIINNNYKYLIHV